MTMTLKKREKNGEPVWVRACEWQRGATTQKRKNAKTQKRKNAKTLLLKTQNPGFPPPFFSNFQTGRASASSSSSLSLSRSLHAASASLIDTLTHIISSTRLSI
jgi:hypothetical protein